MSNNRNLSSLHQHCFACGEKNNLGLQISFALKGNNDVFAVFSFPSRFCGFPDRIQGGIVTAALDSAMANALLLQKVSAYTARIEVRFLKPVLPDTETHVIGSLISKKKGLYYLQAFLFQNGVKLASATSIFKS